MCQVDAVLLMLLLHLENKIFVFKAYFKMFILNPWNLDQTFHLQWNLAKAFYTDATHHVFFGLIAGFTLCNVLVYKNFTTLMECKLITKWQPDK